MSFSSIDISPFVPGCSGELKAVTAAQIALAASPEGGGFFYAVNAGLSAPEEQAMFTAARALFALSQEQKDSIPVTKGGFSRGYIPLGGESGGDQLEVKEAFSYGYNWPADKAPTNSLQGCNVWPDCEGFRVGDEHRVSLESFYARMVEIAEAVARGLALAVGLEENAFTKECVGGDTISLMRLIHYFSEDRGGDRVDKTGSSPHTDWGFLTLIVQDEVGGLQLRRDGAADDAWEDIPPVPFSVLVNVGDYLSILTKGRFISPYHRVVPPPLGVDRLSAVFFFYPAYDACLGEVDAALLGRYSLVAQQQDGEVDNALATESDMLKNVSFGDYIVGKWTQVERQ